MSSVAPSALHRVIPCDEWGALPPRGRILPAPRPNKIIFHHTAGHAPNLDLKPSESYAEAVAYAKAIQRDHMSRKPIPYVDTGNNYLIARTGHIFEGRHGSHEAILKGRMVVSAHCPGQNDQPGIEHEHVGNETMTPAQRSSSVWLHALICQRTGIRPTEIYGHGKYYNTDCPGSLILAIPKLRLDVALAITRPDWYVEALALEPLWAWMLWRDNGQPAEWRPPQIPTRVPDWWWPRYALHKFGRRDSID